MLPTREKNHVIRLKTINGLTSHPKKPTIERGKEIQEMRTLSKKSISLGLTSEICNIIFNTEMQISAICRDTTSWCTL